MKLTKKILLTLLVMTASFLFLTPIHTASARDCKDEEGKSYRICMSIDVNYDSRKGGVDCNDIKNTPKYGECMNDEDNYDSTLTGGEDCEKYKGSPLYGECMNDEDNYDSSSPEYQSCRYLLGMVSWDCNTHFTDGTIVTESDIKPGIITAIANVLVDISIITAYLALGYVMYGGYLYTFSNGDPGKVENGKKTLTQAFIGLGIVILSSVILNSIRIALSADFSKNCTIEGACYSAETAGEMVTGLINWVIGVSGVACVVFVVYGGIMYTTSAGEPNKLQKAKQMITYALIGLAIVVLAETITAFVSHLIRESNNLGVINKSTISKEVHVIKKNN